MNTIYLDNGATSFPKPPAVAQAMFQYLTRWGPPSTGAYTAVPRPPA